MQKNTRIRFNPMTKEIEIEGSETFVKSYFKKLQGMMTGSTDKKAVIKGKVAKKAKGKKVTNKDKIVSLIQGSKDGISTAELKKKTKLNEQQIWNIVNRASKEGKVKKVKRGVYGAA